MNHNGARLHFAPRYCALILVENNSEVYMDSQGQECVFNIEPCTPCEQIRLSHIETDAENYCKIKIEPDSQADLWHS